MPEHSPDQPAGSVAAVDVHHRKGIPLVWLVPVLAAAIGIWLFVKAQQEKGPVVQIAFQSADGLEAEKTKIMLKNVEMGVVEEIHLADDLSHVVLHAELVPEARPHLTTGTQFWVVKPRVSLQGVSGLGTLLSGPYIHLEPGPGEPQLEYTGLEEPPITLGKLPGLHIKLKSDELGSLSVGSGVYFREIRVGDLGAHRLSEDKSSVLVDVLIQPEFAPLIRENTQFWNASGIDVSLSAEGFRVKTESLDSLLGGGVAFETPEVEPSGKPATEGMVFNLYDSREDIGPRYTTHVDFVIYFDSSVRGLLAGAPVEFRGVRIGEVLDVRLEIDPRDMSLFIPVVVRIQPERIDTYGGQEAETIRRERTDEERLAAMQHLVDNGLRASLATGSLVTGALYVEFDLHPDVPVQLSGRKSDYPELPTAPSTLSVLAEKLRNLEIDELVADARKMLQSIDELVNNPDLQAGIGSLEELMTNADQLMTSTHKLVDDLDGEVQPLLTDLEKTLESARGTLDQATSTLKGLEGMVAGDSQVQVLVTQTLKELQGTARSVRVLMDYLERHPESLLRGKGGK